MPADSIRDRIIDDLKAALDFDAGAEYHTATAAVYGWRTPGPQAAAGWPAWSVLDLTEAVTRSARGTSGANSGVLEHRTLTLLIQGMGMVADGGDPDGHARKLLADAQKALKADGTRGGIAEHTHETANRIMVDAPAAPFVMVELDIQVTYRTRRGDPSSTAP